MPENSGSFAYSLRQIEAKCVDSAPILRTGFGETVIITVLGTPAPQGSKKHVGRGIMVESSKKVKPWRLAVEWAVLDAHPLGLRTDGILFRGPVALDVVFTLPKPKSAKRGARPDKKPDIDKLLRSTFDALKTAGMYEDDSRVVVVIASKRYVGDAGAMPVPGASILCKQDRA